MTEISELKNETILSNIAQYPDNCHSLLFAIIIDISEPFKTEESTNYTTKIKVIDPTFNYKSKIESQELKFHKFVHINIFSETPETAPRIQYVGDIIRLRRFKFRFSNKGELIGNMQKFSNWLIYSGSLKGPQISTCFKNYPKNFNRALNQIEQGRLRDLRKWNDQFFFSNSLQFITWWTKFSPPNDINKVDLILKCYKINTKNQTLFFQDEDKIEYELILKVPPKNLENQVIKLRCVNVIQNKKKPNTIKLTSFSSCLLIPSYFYDARIFEKSEKNPRDFKSEEKTFMKFYDSHQIPSNQITAIKSNKLGLKVYTVSDLNQILKETDKNMNKKFVITGYIIGLVEQKAENVIKALYQGKVYDYNHQFNKDETPQFIYNVVMLLLDDKMKQNNQQAIHVYITTNQSDTHVFSNWEILPELNKIKEWQNIKAKDLRKFEKKLRNISNPKNKIKIVVKLVKTQQGQCFFKLTDTVFLNF